jgi:hypothetical protein
MKPPTFELGTFTVISDMRRVEKIRLHCRCGRVWEELLPGELHRSELVVRLTCPGCGRAHHIHNRQLIQLNEEEGVTHDGRKEQQTRYDA